ncbi:winged helix-turn-helix DNA-binding domain protein [Vibrio phage 1.118.B._10N.261.49.F6]|nr:winged helix-turn-helix DNA-binding domain protein [Vibrio phage 1.118.A._10N.261.49.F6]AUR88947.1 winged helix-turn-helix DNA-binding domain protein [Vibrio phage 1.118.B._10N.261.49.F6]AUR97149.1 winged helix-turn-helix DNA-binding domain protein [Vibrio phage 1.237.A._10N.261.52.C5]AUR97244.1 winged helix-turn-helix DNA-binding domain protein [Vibrio phage 1.237.B._10N.261.52.C5]
MIRITIIETHGHVLYTLDTDYELENVSRICSFLTSPFALNEIQTRKARTLQAGDKWLEVRPCLPDQALPYETYESLKRVLEGHSLPIEGQYISKHLEQKQGEKIPLQLVHDDYVLFCEKNHYPYMPLKRFGKVLRDKYGVTTKQSSYKTKNLTCLFNYDFV